ncbi:MAG: class I SAM-dependent methyltransferase [Gaiellaceae bacterium]
MTDPQTWHYGVIAEWWAQFNTDGPEIEYFGRFVESGQPALDAGCGTGRLLLPWLRAGFDVDGCDVSGDMVALARERARREDVRPTLFVQPLHELAPARRYRTVVVCGVFGLGTTRAQDERALVRLHDALEADGTLLLDNQAPYFYGKRWRQWTPEERRLLPEPWPPPGERRRAADGSEYRLRSRAVDVDPLDQRIALEMLAEKWVDDHEVASETHAITIRMYFRDELVMMLERAGFTEIDVSGGYTDAEPTPDDEYLVFSARRR